MNRYHNLIQYVILKSVVLLLVLFAGTNAKAQITLASGKAAHLWEQPDTTADVLAYPYIERRDSMVFTYGDLQSGYKFMEREGSMEGNYCANRRLRKARVTVRLDLGPDYRYGKNAFQVTVPFVLTLYGTSLSWFEPAGGFSFYNLIINQDKPEAEYTVVYEPSAVSPEHTTADYDQVYFIDASIWGLASTNSAVNKDVRFTVFLYEEYEIDAHRIGGSLNPLVEPVKVTGGNENPVHFAWNIDAACNDTFPGYQLQVLRLYNTDPDKKSDEEVKAIVDWSQALTIEIEKKKTSVDLTLAEGTGYYIWRVRPIGSYYEGGFADSRNWGEWSDAPADGDILEYTDPNATPVLTNDALFYYEQFDDDKNWMHNRSFTEGGLAHEGIQYTNTLAQPVQQQSLVKSEGNKLVSQTLYDYSGRPALSSMVVPLEGNAFGYVSSMLQQTGGGSYTAANFDQDGNYREPDAAGGFVATYYSATNTDEQIPDAEGYPFSRALFEEDGTGRIREAGGVGSVHRLKESSTDRTAKVYYSSVSEQELVKLFGDEAPDDASVVKRLTTDPNKVTSVEYVSKEGQVIATCYEKIPGDELLLDLSEDETVLSTTVADTIRRSVRSGDNVYRAQKRYSFTNPTEVTISYSLTPPTASMTDEGDCVDYCATCEYVVWIRVHNVHDPADMQEYPIVISPTDCETSTSGTVSQTITLLPGTYIIERYIDSNPVDENNKTAAQRFKDAIAAQVRGTLTSHPTIVALNALLEEGDIEGFYEYLGVTDLDAAQNTEIEIETDCCTLRIPVIAPECARNACRNGTPDFEAYLIDKWGSKYGDGSPNNLNKYFWHYGGADKYPDNTTFPNGYGAFNQMITNMLAETVEDEPLYNCQNLWECWTSFVDAYEFMAHPGGVKDVRFDLLEAFLDCTGRRYINKTVVAYSSTAGYLTHAYKMVYDNSSTHAEAWTHCTSVIGSWTTWVNQPDSSAQWKRFYDCVRTYDYMKSNNNNEDVKNTFENCFEDDMEEMEPEDRFNCAVEQRNRMQGACQQQCESMRWLYIDRIVKEFEESGAGSVQWDVIACLADALIAECREKCKLDILTREEDGELEVDGVGTEQQWENVQQVYSQVIEIHLPDGDECPDNSYELKQGWSVDYKDLILDHLNQKLVEFRATVGIDGAVWNFKSALQEVAPLDIVNSFSSYEVMVSPDAEMTFEVDDNCQLWFKRQNNCYGNDIEHPLVAHLNNYLNTFWGYQIPGTGQEYDDGIYTNYYSLSDYYVTETRDFVISNLPSDYHTKLAMYTDAEFSCINGRSGNQPLSSFIHLLGPADRTSIDAWRRRIRTGSGYLKYPSIASVSVENFKIFDIGIYFDDWNIIESYWSRGVWNQQDMKSTLNSFYARSCGTTEPAVVKQYLDIHNKAEFDRHVYDYFTTSSYAVQYTTKIGHFGQDEEGYLVYYSYVSYDESGDSLAFDLDNPIAHRICSVRFFGRDSVKVANDVCSTFVCPDMCIRWVPLPYDPVEVVDELKPALCKPTVLKQIYGALGEAIERCVTSRVKNAEDIYRNSCLDVSDLNDVFTVSYPIDYTHFTLYYYDRAGSLLKTVPPKGIRLNASSRLDVPNHKMVTYYQYNTLGQIVYTKDNDRGERRYAHDDKLRIKMAQNSVQNSNDKVSYTKYDELGRVIETGETDYPTGGGSNFYTNSELADPAFPSTGEQRTYLVYGQKIADVSTPVAGIPDQENLRNTLSYTYTDDEVYSVYSYDVHGNTMWFAQDIPGMQRTNLVEYEYDLVSGLVRQQAYNKESPDRLFHRFVYDDDMRMTQVQTSRDGHIWDSDARYSYYPHGPLRRREIGEDSLQGVDYTYTLQGWLKAINHPKSPTVGSGSGSGINIDPGRDGLSGSINPTVPQDAFGSELFYYHGDFTRGVFTTSEATFLDGTPLYNGMIASHSSQVLTVSDPDLVYQGLTGEDYRYDMIGRLRKSQFNTYSSGWQQEDDYLSSYTYDPNGNMRTLKRNANTGMSGIVMDDHTFGYYAPGGVESNRLESVTEGSPLPNAVTEDIDNLGAGNYIYNANGQLVSDQSMVPVSNNTNSITWNVSGKVQSVQQELATGLVKNTTYTYDATGNKVKERSVTVFPGPGGSTEEHIQYYVYDAGGTLLAVYEQDCESSGEGRGAFRAPRAGFTALEESECDAPVVCKDLIIYGMSREGVVHPDAAIVPPVSDGRIFYRELGDKEYELTDHLGNVRVTLSDIKLSLLTGNVNDPPYNFRVDSLSTGNYYPFGMAQPHRNWRRPNANNLYRFRYNGMEEDLGGSLFGNTYSTMFRQLDARLGRWWSPDLVVNPSESPYAGMGNNPVSYVDPLGLAPIDPNKIWGSPVNPDEIREYEGMHFRWNEQKQKWLSSVDKVIEITANKPTEAEQREYAEWYQQWWQQNAWRFTPPPSRSETQAAANARLQNAVATTDAIRNFFVIGSMAPIAAVAAVEATPVVTAIGTKAFVNYGPTAFLFFARYKDQIIEGGEAVLDMVVGADYKPSFAGVGVLKAEAEVAGELIETGMKASKSNIGGALKNVKWPWKKMPSALELSKASCDADALKIQEIVGGKIVTIYNSMNTNNKKNEFTIGAVKVGEESVIWFYHKVVQRGDIIYDRITGPSGMHIDDYKKLFDPDMLDILTFE